MNKKQLEAYDMALDETVKVMVINGAAGTGKSYVVNKIAEFYEKRASRLAPTGRAAFRINGKTIHSWLSPDIQEDMFGKITVLGFNKERAEPHEIIIIDESSMIDNELWKSVIDTLGETNKVIFVGDSAQLSPVGEGEPFKELIDKGQNVVTLEEIMRTEGDNDIPLFADKVRKGEPVDETYNNVKQLGLNDMIDTVVKNHVDNQIIIPTSKGNEGTHSINEKIQKLVGNDEVAYQTLRWMKVDGKWKPVKAKDINFGDKIIFTKNLYNTMVPITNGTMGYVIKEGMGKAVSFAFGMRTETVVIGYYFEIEGFDDLVFVPQKQCQWDTDLGYAITIHKAQGSEWNNVFCVFTPGQMRFLDKKNIYRSIYTAITRAKEITYIVS